jgi:hypothetical protein
VAILYKLVENSDTKEGYNISFTSEDEATLEDEATRRQTAIK